MAVVLDPHLDSPEAAIVQSHQRSASRSPNGQYRPGPASPSPDSSLSRNYAAPAVGDCVKVRPPGWTPSAKSSRIDSLFPSDRLREAIVVKAPDASSQVYALLFDDEVEETDVEFHRIVFELGTPCLPAASASFQSSAYAGSRSAASGVRPTHLSPREGFLQRFMLAAGGAPSLAGQSVKERAFAQGILHAALQHLAQRSTVPSRHLYQTFAGAAARDFATEHSLTGDLLTSWQEDLSGPALDALQFLAAEKVLHVRETTVECQEVGCSRCKVSAQQLFVLWEPQLPALACTCRFTRPTWDALKRCHKRCQRHSRNMDSVCGRPPISPKLTPPRRRPLVPRLHLGDVQAAKRQCGRAGSAALAGRAESRLACQPACSRSSSSTQLDRYRRRSLPVLCGAQVIHGNRSLSPAPRSLVRT